MQENDEPMVKIMESKQIVFSDYAKQQPESTTIRKSVLEKLEQVANSLPKNYQLLIIEGYRSMTSQQKSWDRMWEKVKTAGPNLTETEIEKRVRLYVAKPSPLANHNCGGAIDVTLAYNGAPIDMGTRHPNEEDDVIAIPKFPMFSNKITEEQKANRSILRDAMTKADFVYYPEEWWHYCWGDRMWAVYTNRDSCFYGPLSKDI